MAAAAPTVITGNKLFSFSESSDRVPIHAPHPSSVFRQNRRYSAARLRRATRSSLARASQTLEIMDFAEGYLRYILFQNKQDQRLSVASVWREATEKSRFSTHRQSLPSFFAPQIRQNSDKLALPYRTALRYEAEPRPPREPRGPVSRACHSCKIPLTPGPFHRRSFAVPALRVRSGGEAPPSQHAPPRFNRKGTLRSGSA